MALKHPVEYLTLVSGQLENYALVYGQRLAQPNTCPLISNAVNNAVTMTDRCANCVSQEYHKAGETRYTRVRIHLNSLLVNGNISHP